MVIMPKIRQLHKNIKIEAFKNLNKNNQQHFRNKQRFWAKIARMRCAQGQTEMNIDILDDALGTVCIYVCMAVVRTTER